MEIGNFDELAALFERRLREIGYRCTVNYVGRGWYRVRKIGSLGDGLKKRAEEIKAMIDKG